jgi:hypothetical protein
MKFLSWTVIAISLSVGSAFGWDPTKYSATRHWQTSIEDDPLDGQSIAVQAAALKEDGSPGLLTIRKLYDELELSITDVNEFYCPTPGEDYLRVRVWFSDTKQVLETKWQVASDNTGINPYHGDSSEIVDRMMDSEDTIFRVIDGCGDVTDYMVSSTNGRQELASAGF